MSDNTEIYVIPIATSLAGMHVQTLRNYDQLGLVTPQRTSGGGCRYTKRGVALLREIQRLSQEDGVNLAGIKAITDLTERVDSLERENVELQERLYQAKVQARCPRGELVHVPRSMAVVMWEPRARRRHKANRGGEG